MCNMKVEEREERGRGKEGENTENTAGRKEAEKDKTKVGKGRRGCTSVALSFINVEFIANICNLGCCI